MRKIEDGFTAELIIICAGGLARAVATHNTFYWEIRGFLDTPKTEGERHLGYPVFSKPLENFMGRYIIVTGNINKKRLLAERFNDLPFATVQNFHSVISPHASISFGSVICPGVVIDCGVDVGKHVYVDHNAVIGHDANLGDFCHIAPLVMVGGSAKIGEGTFVGANTVIFPHVKIGEGCIIGAGAVVRTDVPDHECWVGVPAKPLREGIY